MFILQNDPKFAKIRAVFVQAKIPARLKSFRRGSVGIRKCFICIQLMS